MKKTIFILFIICFSGLLFAQKKQSKKVPSLKQSLNQYFASIQKKYHRNRKWKTKLIIYRFVFPEFSKLIQGNAKGAQKKNPLLAYYYTGMMSGLLDMKANLDYLEGKLYQGEWMKSSGLLLKKAAPNIYRQSASMFNRAKMEYYKLFHTRKPGYVKKIFTKIFKLLMAETKKSKAGKSTKVFLSGYVNAYLFYFSFNSFLDGKVKSEALTELFMRMLQPGKK